LTVFPAYYVIALLFLLFLISCGSLSCQLFDRAIGCVRDARRHVTQDQLQVTPSRTTYMC